MITSKCFNFRILSVYFCKRFVPKHFRTHYSLMGRSGWGERLNNWFSSLQVSLTHFSPMSHIYTLWKHQKTYIMTVLWRFQEVWKCDIGLKWVKWHQQILMAQTHIQSVIGASNLKALNSKVIKNHEKLINRSSRPEVLFKKTVLKNFTGKHHCQSHIFFASGLQLYWKIDSGTGVFLWILRNF